MTRIHGEARLDTVPFAIEGATLVLRVEDSRRADAPAVVVAEHRICGISRAAGNADPVQFALMLPAQAPPGGGWSLRVELCSDPSRGLRQGDYASTERCALLPTETERPLRIVLHRLR